MKQHTPIDVKEDRGPAGEIERVSIRFGPQYAAKFRRR